MIQPHRRLALDGSGCAGIHTLRAYASERPPGEGEQVHARLAGKVLAHVRLPRPWERVAELGFGTRVSDAPSHAIFLEVMGRHSNLILADADGSIEGCGHQVGAQQSRLRQLQSGSRYELPPPNAQGLEPSASEPHLAWQQNIVHGAEHSKGPTTMVNGLIRAYQGVSPALARELLSSANLPHTCSPHDVGDGEWQRLHDEWQRWLAMLELGSFSAASDPRTGQLSVLGGVKGETGSVHAVLDEHFRAQQDTDSFAKLQQSVAAILARAVKRVDGKVASFSKDLAAAAGSEGTARRAELIMANLHRCQQGDISLEAEDWDTGENVRIPLDGKQPPVKSAEALFGKARKQRRAVNHLEPLLQAAKEELEYLGDVQAQLHMLQAGAEGDLQALQGIQDELVQNGYAKPSPDAAAAAKGAAKGRKAAKRAKGSASSSHPFRQFTSPSGLTVLVGRNNRQNDDLTHRVAQPGDLWMHARGVPGAHTVLRVPSGREAASEDVQFAADLAAWFSRARSEGKADVTMCKAADVKRPKGGKPGQALVTRERTHVGRPSSSAAATDLASDSS